jgi:Arc/MetJ family transcription regulator
MNDGVMRTTIDLPDDLHQQAISIARDTSRSLSETVAVLMRRGLSQGLKGEIARSAVTGMPIVHLGTMITTVESGLDRGRRDGDDLHLVGEGG